jgi:NikR C terminal nickel binding domain
MSCDRPYPRFATISISILPIAVAIGDMVRDHLVEHRQETTDSDVAGTITLVDDHHRPRVQKTLTDLQHHRVDTIISRLHMHLDRDNCLEVLVVHGRASMVRSVEKTRCRSEGNCVLQPGITAASTDATKV